MTGMWTSIPPLQNNESWIHHVIFKQPGAATFLFIDFFILIAAGTLIIIQAYQVIFLLYPRVKKPNCEILLKGIVVNTLCNIGSMSKKWFSREHGAFYNLGTLKICYLNAD